MVGRKKIKQIKKETSIKLKKQQKTESVTTLK